MNKVYLVLALAGSAAFSVPAAPVAQNPSAFSPSGAYLKDTSARQNLIGEVVSVEAGKIIVKTASGSVTVAVGDKTVFRRVPPGQTSLASAETITLADVKAGDRILIPGGAANEQTAARQVIIMAREAITAQRTEEAERRRARTIVGRITVLDAAKKEFTVQTRGREAAETLTVALADSAKVLRYAPDSLKLSDAVAGSFADLRVGDQVRVIGDRSADSSRVTAEEIFSGSIARAVGSIVNVNAATGELTVKNAQSGQTMIVAVGKNTTLRRIPAEAIENFRQRAGRRQQRQQERAGGQTNGVRQTPATPEERRARREQRNAENPNRQARQPGQGGGGMGMQFENFPAVTLAELKTGDAVLITGTGSGDASRMTAVTLVTGGAEMQQFFQRTQGGGRNNPTSPGLPGNVGGGNQVNDRDEPRR